MPSQLADFARLFEKVRERWPDAPGLPEGYYINRTVAGLPSTPWMRDPDLDMTHERAALALCVTTAMEIGAWWVAQDHCRAGGAVFSGGFDFRMFSPNGIDFESKPLPSLPTAALAMLRGIVEP